MEVEIADEEVMSVFVGGLEYGGGGVETQAEEHVGQEQTREEKAISGHGSVGQV
jgi:hypothetical protein